MIAPGGSGKPHFIDIFRMIIFASPGGYGCKDFEAIW
jgi:hypothetical protein